MRAQYGPRVDVRAGCWIHRTPSGERYCMRPVGQHFVSTHDGRRLYLLVEGLPIDDTGAPSEIGTHAAAGVVGAFTVALHDTSSERAPAWRLLAAAKSLRYGSFGRAGATGAAFVRLGPADYYGWIFVSGGTWQGESVGSHIVLAPRGTRVVEIGSIASMVADDQRHRQDIVIDDSAEGVKVFPLVVTRWRLVNGKVDPPAVRTTRIEFDERRWRYRWPPQLH